MISKKGNSTPWIMIGAIIFIVLIIIIIMIVKGQIGNQSSLVDNLPNNPISNIG